MQQVCFLIQPNNIDTIKKHQTAIRINGLKSELLNGVVMINGKNIKANMENNNANNSQKFIGYRPQYCIKR